LKKDRLRKFRHVECEDDADRAYPRKTCWDGAKQDIKFVGLSQDGAQVQNESKENEGAVN